jgi:hypothetical protein
MPFIKSIVFKCCALLTTYISLNGEIISLCSYCIKKGLVYITLIAPFSRQPSFYSGCIKANTYLLYDVYSVPLNKCIYLTVHYYTL